MGAPTALAAGIKAECCLSQLFDCCSIQLSLPGMAPGMTPGKAAAK